MKKITLQVSGRERTFTEEELTAIVEQHFANEAEENVSKLKVAKAPTEGQWFEVNPLDIDQTIFKKKKEDKKQEETRQLILEAFAEVKSNPKKYGKNFKTMFPKKTWESAEADELIELAEELGDHNADWVEQALEWAQRIANGESWKTICNMPDTANWYRLVVWKNGYVRRVGGSCDCADSNPASYVGCRNFFSIDTRFSTVPLVVA